jgi:hypothetical protein
MCFTWAGSNVAYFVSSSVSKKKRFITLATSVVVIKHFFKARFSFAACPCQLLSAYPIDIGLGWKGLPGSSLFALFVNDKKSF